MIQLIAPHARGSRDIWRAQRAKAVMIAQVRLLPFTWSFQCTLVRMCFCMHEMLTARCSHFLLCTLNMGVILLEPTVYLTQSLLVITWSNTCECHSIYRPQFHAISQNRFFCWCACLFPHLNPFTIDIWTSHKKLYPDSVALACMSVLSLKFRLIYRGPCTGWFDSKSSQQ